MNYNLLQSPGCDTCCNILRLGFADVYIWQTLIEKHSYLEYGTLSGMLSFCEYMYWQRAFCHSGTAFDKIKIAETF